MSVLKMLKYCKGRVGTSQKIRLTEKAGTKVMSMKCCKCLYIVSCPIPIKCALSLVTSRSHDI